jgi:hypothetical protein
MLYSLLKNTDDGIQVLTVLHDGETFFATSDTHPGFAGLVLKVLADDESVVDDFTVEKAVATRFDRLSERVAVANGQVYFDGDVVDDSLTEQILRFVEEQVDDWYPLVMFFEKVQQNPSEHSREQLFRWLAKHQFTLTSEGDIVGYKGVTDDLLSIHAGPAIVDGVAMDGQIPNQPGSTIEMARSSVQFDPLIGCASGLHVANWRYASSWGTKTLEVHVNPRDVVSVPTDSADEKVRVCRYVVIGEVAKPYVGAVLTYEMGEDGEPVPEDYDDDYCCEDCDSGDYEDDDEDESDVCGVCGNDCGWCATSNVDDEPSVEIGGFISGGYGSGKSTVDTRQNYTKQVRDANGRFLRKS